MFKYLLVFPVLTILCICLNAQDIHKLSAENDVIGFLEEDPKLYFAPNEEIIVAWQDHRYGTPVYFMQRFVTELMPVNSAFEIFSNIDLVINQNNQLFCNLDIDSYDPLGGGCFTTYGAIYQNEIPVKTNFPFYGECYGWCGTGFTGENRRTIPANDGFLFMGRYDRVLKFIRIYGSGDFNQVQNELIFQDYERAVCAIDIARFNDSLNVVSWMELSSYDSLEGVYYGFLDDRDSLICKYELKIETASLNSFLQVFEFPLLNISVLSDERIMIFIFDRGKNKLFSFNITEMNHVEVDSLSIKSYHDYPEYDKLNVTNQDAAGNFYMIFKEQINIAYFKYYAYKFDASGNYLSTFEDSLNIDLINKNIKYTGNESFITTARSGMDVYLFKTDKLQKTDSVKIETGTFNSNERASDISVFDDETFFVSWQTGPDYFGRKVGIDGVIDEQLIQLAGKITRFNDNYGISYGKNRISFFDKNFNILKIDTLITNNDSGNKITAEKLSDSLVVVSFINGKTVGVRIYRFNGELIKEILFDPGHYLYGDLKIHPNDDDTFWLQYGFQYFTLLNAELAVIKAETPIKGRPVLKLQHDLFFSYLTYFDDFSGHYIGYLFNIDGDTVQVFNEMPPYTHAFSAFKINENSFMLTWQEDEGIRARVFHVDGNYQNSFLIHKNSDDNVSYVDGTFARLNNKAIFSWSDNRVRDEGYSVYGRIENINTITSIDNNNSGQPLEFFLSAAYPNPFNPSTKFNISIPENDLLDLKIYDIRGRVIKSLLHKEMPRGSYTFDWDGRDSANNPVSSGMYFLSVRYNNLLNVKKLVLLK